MKDQDVDEAHGKGEGVYSKGGVPYVVILRDEEVGGLDMISVLHVTVSEQRTVKELITTHIQISN